MQITFFNFAVSSESVLANQVALEETSDLVARSGKDIPERSQHIRQNTFFQMRLVFRIQNC